MRALTLRNPWPFAITSLPPEMAKDIENRRWPAPPAIIGRDIAIHAGQGADDVVFPLTEANRLYLAACRRKDPAVAVRGAVVAVVTVVGCHLDGRQENCHGRICSPWAIEDGYHWQIASVRTLAGPVPCAGHQKLWPLPEEVESAVRAQLGEK